MRPGFVFYAPHAGAARRTAHTGISASFLAELSVSSPRKKNIFIIYKNIFWIKVSKKHFI